MIFGDEAGDRLAGAAWEAWYALVRGPAMFWGLQRRRRGYYDLTTQRLLAATGAPRESLGALLRDVAFQRDLGNVPSVAIAQRLLQWPKPVSRGQLLRYANVVLEGGGSGRHLVEKVGLRRLQEIALHSPPVAQTVWDSSGELSPPARALARLQSSQHSWRGQFLQELAEQSGAPCVVGNSDRLRGLGQGSSIDAHGTVIRFNRCSTARLSAEDVGRRLGVWVLNPSLDLEQPPGGALPRWVLLSGADPRYQLRQWGRVVQWLSKGCRVLTTPLSVWQNLVAETKAPPSAGLLVLSWLVENLAPNRPVRAFGFDTQRADSRWTGRCRHSWPAEAEFLRKLRTKGLVPQEAGVPIRSPFNPE